MSSKSIPVKAMLKELGRVRRQQAKRIQQKRSRRDLLRRTMGQGLNLIGYLIVTGIVATVLLNL